MTLSELGWGWGSSRALLVRLSPPLSAHEGHWRRRTCLCHSGKPLSSPSSAGAKSAGTFAPHPALSGCQECLGQGHSCSDHLSPGAQSCRISESFGGNLCSRNMHTLRGLRALVILCVTQVPPCMRCGPGLVTALGRNCPSAGTSWVRPQEGRALGARGVHRGLCIPELPQSGVSSSLTAGLGTDLAGKCLWWWTRPPQSFLNQRPLSPSYPWSSSGSPVGTAGQYPFLDTQVPPPTPAEALHEKDPGRRDLGGGGLESIHPRCQIHPSHGIRHLYWPPRISPQPPVVASGEWEPQLQE